MNVELNGHKLVLLKADVSPMEKYLDKKLCGVSFIPARDVIVRDALITFDTTSQLLVTLFVPDIQVVLCVYEYMHVYMYTCVYMYDLCVYVCVCTCVC